MTMNKPQVKLSENFILELDLLFRLTGETGAIQRQACAQDFSH